VLAHTGVEYSGTPTERHVALARNLCRYGADAVFLSHTHVLQPTEIFEVEDEGGALRTCFIAFSMGNFIAGRDSRPSDAGAIIYLDYEKVEEEHGNVTRLKHVSFAPTWVRFKNKSDDIDVKVLPVSETIMAIAANEEVDIRERDIKRLHEVYRHTTGKLLGEVPDEILPILTLYRLNAADHLPSETLNPPANEYVQTFMS